MADVPPVATPPSPIPAPAPEAPKTGIAGAMELLDAGVADLEKKSAAPEAPKEPPKADAPKPPAAPPTTPEPEVEPVWDKAPKNLKNAYFKLKRETEGKLSDLEKKNKELEGKSTQSPADLEKIKANESRIEQLQQQLAERETTLIESDYSRSAEFKRDYVDTANTAFKDAVDEIKLLNITITNPETEEKSERPATEADFRALLKLEPREQDKKIDELFGASSKRVMLHIAELKRIERAANQAISKAKEKAGEKATQTAAERTKKSEEFKLAEKTAEEEIIKLNPAHFAPDETNPESSKALSNGLKFFDDTTSGHTNLSTKEMAERAVILRYGFAAYARLAVVDKQKTAKITALEEELSKYRKSSPGSAAPSGAAVPPAEKTKSLSEAAKAFDAIKDK